VLPNSRSSYIKGCFDLVDDLKDAVDEHSCIKLY